ncbi:MAG: site-2 protease family protein [Proteobacteria bacterium]|nr:site-2 protease family protein [Pseudomonadota bacterium]
MATCASVFAVRALQWDAGAGRGLFDALVFTFVLIGILLAHELGHYITARVYGFRLSLPLFLPIPVWIGTLGAIIDVREYPRSRGGLVAMGAAGPLAGFAVVVMVAAVAMARGLDPVGADEPFVLSTPLLFRALGWWTGEGTQISTGDPLAFAAWIGCLVTAINLLPFGQLDGGHAFSALWPERASTAAWVVTGGLLALALWWPWWMVWAIALQVLGARQPMKVRNGAQPPTPLERRLGLLLIPVFVLCFTAMPIR